MQLVDTHCHLDEEAFGNDLNATIQRAVEAGVSQMVSIGITLASSQRAIALAEQNPAVFAAVGIHPNYTSVAGADDWSQVCQLAPHPRVVAVGETGLDRYWDHAPIELQRDYFARHVELAREVGKPFIIHCREAEADVCALLREWSQSGPLAGVMHSFCGNRETLQVCLEAGLHISFAGMVTFKKNVELRELSREVPLERLLVETDAPYLAPSPNRGKRNEPAWVPLTLAALAAERQIDRAELAACTTANARRLFGLPAPH